MSKTDRAKAPFPSWDGDGYGGAEEHAEFMVGDGRASRVIRHFENELRAGDNIVIAIRVSRCEQDRRGNLQDAEAFLRGVVERRGANTIEVVSHIGSGWDPYWLGFARAIAEGCDGKILAISTDRLIRNVCFHSKTYSNAQASENSLNELKSVLGDVVAMTYLHPDATPSEVRAFRSKFGQDAKGAKGGRPPKNPAGYKRGRRLKMQPEVIEMHQQGQSVRRIAKETGVPKETVRRWIASCEQRLAHF